MSQYTVDASKSRFTVQAFASGLLKSFGHNPTIGIRDFSGELRFDPDAPDEATLQMKVQANSLEVTDKVSDKDRHEIENGMKDEVLEIETYPEISYESTHIATTKVSNKWFRLQITGQLSLHGQTKEHHVDAQLKPRDGELRLSGNFTLQQTDYNIKLFSVMGGTMKLKDELRFNFDIVARETS
jgi:polyisoprenoid-binding protein YceI